MAGRKVRTTGGLAVSSDRAERDAVSIVGSGVLETEHNEERGEEGPGPSCSTGQGPYRGTEGRREGKGVHIPVCRKTVV
jgi:hypothetical protein